MRRLHRPPPQARQRSRCRRKPETRKAVHVSLLSLQARVRTLGLTLQLPLKHWMPPAATVRKQSLSCSRPVHRQRLAAPCRRLQNHRLRPVRRARHGHQLHPHRLRMEQKRLPMQTPVTKQPRPPQEQQALAMLLHSLQQAQRKPTVQLAQPRNHYQKTSRRSSAKPRGAI